MISSPANLIYIEAYFFQNKTTILSMHIIYDELKKISDEC